MFSGAQRPNCFRLLDCAARYIDCAGPETFRQNGWATEPAFVSDSTLPKDVTFGEVNDVITRIGAFLIEERVAPLHFPLPRRNPVHE